MSYIRGSILYGNSTQKAGEEVEQRQKRQKTGPELSLFFIHRMSQQVLVKISKLRQIRILNFFVKKKNRQIEGRSALLRWNVNKL